MAMAGGLAYAQTDIPTEWIDPNTKEDKKVIDIPQGVSIANVNCEETLAGGTIDLQTPRSRVFWVARYDIETKRRTWAEQRGCP